MKTVAMFDIVLRDARLIQVALGVIFGLVVLSCRAAFSATSLVNLSAPPVQRRHGP